MLASITPLGERSRRQHWWLTVSALIAGGVASGAAVGAGLAALGAAFPVPAVDRLAVVVVAAAAALLLDAGALGLRLPGHTRQVDETWLTRYRGFVYGLGFGAQLGVGVATIVTTAGVYVTLVAEALARNATSGAAIGAAFGLIRGASVLTTVQVDSPQRLAAFHSRLDRIQPVAAGAALAAQAVAVVAAASML